MLITKLSRWCALTAISVSLIACQSTSEPIPTQSVNHMPLTLERIYKDDEFSAQWLGQIRWLADGSGYTAIEKSEKTKITDKNSNDDAKKAESIGKDIVFYDPNTLARQVLISAEQLIPTGQNQALSIDNYLWSDDRTKLLIYTNSKKVWRSNSRGDYWILNIKNQKNLILNFNDFSCHIIKNSVQCCDD